MKNKERPIDKKPKINQLLRVPRFWIRRTFARKRGIRYEVDRNQCQRRHKYRKGVNRRQLEDHPSRRGRFVSPHHFVHHEHIVNFQDHGERHPQIRAPPVRIVPPEDFAHVRGSRVREDVCQICHEARQVDVRVGKEAEDEVQVIGACPHLGAAKDGDQECPEMPLHVIQM